MTTNEQPEAGPEHSGLSPLAVRRKERIDADRASRAAAAVARRIEQAARREMSPFDKALARAQEDQWLDRIAERVMEILPPILRGLCENLPASDTTMPSPRLSAFLTAEENEQPCAYWGAAVGGGGGYKSYFRVINASTTDSDVCKIGVTNGSSEMLDPVGNCGAVKINGERVDVEAITETITADGVYHVWIHSWIDAADGPDAEIIVGPVDDDTPPDNPNGGIAFANQLAGRVTVEDDAITAITQDYLRGGEHFELLYGDCSGETLLT